MQRPRSSLVLRALALAGSAQAATTITIATVNNPDMVTMQKLTPEFNKKYPDINVKWVVLPENELRQKITLDVASGAGASTSPPSACTRCRSGPRTAGWSPSRPCSRRTRASPAPTGSTTCCPACGMR